MIAHGGGKARIVKAVQKLSFAHKAPLGETGFNYVGGESAYDIDLFDCKNPSGISAHRFRRARLYGLRQHGDRRLLDRLDILCIKRKRGRRKCDGGQYESVL